MAKQQELVDEVQGSIKCQEPSAGRIGLENIGNSCYLSSVLQCVAKLLPTDE
jgi:ubiquitin C-terminal hydrolase